MDNRKLSFEKLAAEQKRHEEVKGSNVVLYDKALSYIEYVLGEVKAGKSFSLDAGILIIEKIVESQNTNDSIFAKAIHADDPDRFHYYHSVNIAIYAIKIAEGLGWDREKQVEIGIAGLLHDVGMGSIPDNIIYKKEELDDKEFQIFKDRPKYSYEILQAFKEDHPYLAECAIQVYERLDGSGYPQGLMEEEIHEYAQIIGLVDVYEAFIHSRPYRNKFLPFFTIKGIIKTGKKQFKREYLKVLLSKFSIFPLQSYVQLNSGAIGRVIETYPNQLMRPKLKIIYDSQKRKVLTERIIELPKNPLLYIKDSVAEGDLENLPALFEKEEISSTDDMSDTEKEEADTDAEQAAFAPRQKQTKKPLWRRPLFLLGIALIIIAAIIMIIKINNKQPDQETDAPSDVSGYNTPDSTGSNPPEPDPLSVEEPESRLPEITKSDSADSHTDFVMNVAPVEESYDAPEPVALIPEEIEPDPEKKDLPEEVVSKDEISQNTEQPEAVENHMAEEDDMTEAIEVHVKKPPEPAEVPVKGKTALQGELKRLPYSILLASCRTQERLQMRLGQVQGMGLSPYWVKVDLGSGGKNKGLWIRLFSGYFGSYAEAEKVRKEKGLTRALVKKTQYASFLGKYSYGSELDERIALLKKDGYSPYWIDNGDGMTVMLYVGAFFTQDGADAKCSELVTWGIECMGVER